MRRFMLLQIRSCFSKPTKKQQNISTPQQLKIIQQINLQNPSNADNLIAQNQIAKNIKQGNLNTQLQYYQKYLNIRKMEKQQQKKQEQPTFDSIMKRWDGFSDVYSSMDACPQTFFFTLINQLKIRKAMNILQIACGAGLLLPFVIDQKHIDAQYIATDLSPAMLKKAQQRLKLNFEKYQSKLTFEEWLKKQKVVLKEVNGQEPVYGYGVFDIVICNLVLMLTVNPKNILTSVHKMTTDNAQMGITIWGDKTRSNFFALVSKAIKKLNLPVPNKRSPFYYQEQIHADLVQTGWEIVFQWQQTAPFPLTEPDDIDPYLATLGEAIQSFSSEEQTKIKELAKQLYIEELKNHIPMIMSNKLFIVKKKKSE